MTTPGTLSDAWADDQEIDFLPPKPTHAADAVDRVAQELVRIYSLGVSWDGASESPRAEWRKFAQRVLDAAGLHEPAAQPVAPADTDVRRILLDIVPGEDGMGLEVYAKTVADVEAVLSKLWQRIEELESAQPVAVPAWTEAMLEAACDAYAFAIGSSRDAMRAALTAALTAAPTQEPK